MHGPPVCGHALVLAKCSWNWWSSPTIVGSLSRTLGERKLIAKHAALCFFLFLDKSRSIAETMKKVRRGV